MNKAPLKVKCGVGCKHGDIQGHLTPLLETKPYQSHGRIQHPRDPNESGLLTSKFLLLPGREGKGRVVFCNALVFALLKMLPVAVRNKDEHEEQLNRTGSLSVFDAKPEMELPGREVISK